MESIVLLDTCVLFDFLAGQRKTVVSQTERLLLEAKAAVSVVTVFELLRGVQSDKHITQRKNLIGLCTVLDLTPQISERAAGIYSDLKRKGLSIHTEDILIGATALHWHYSVLTSNTKDFSRISGLRLSS